MYQLYCFANANFDAKSWESNYFVAETFLPKYEQLKALKEAPCTAVVRVENDDDINNCLRIYADINTFKLALTEQNNVKCL